MNIYTVEDYDSHDIYAFLDKKSAITFMYNKCKQWGAILSVFQNGEYITLEKLYQTDEEKILFLINCSQETLNDIFYCYWVCSKVALEDC